MAGRNGQPTVSRDDETFAESFTAGSTYMTYPQPSHPFPLTGLIAGPHRMPRVHPGALAYRRSRVVEVVMQTNGDCDVVEDEERFEARMVCERQDSDPTFGVPDDPFWYTVIVPAEKLEPSATCLLHTPPKESAKQDWITNLLIMAYMVSRPELCVDPESGRRMQKQDMSNRFFAGSSYTVRGCDKVDTDRVKVAIELVQNQHGNIVAYRFHFFQIDTAFSFVRGIDNVIDDNYSRLNPPKKAPPPPLDGIWNRAKMVASHYEWAHRYAAKHRNSITQNPTYTRLVPKAPTPPKTTKNGKSKVVVDDDDDDDDAPAIVPTGKPDLVQAEEDDFFGSSTSSSSSSLKRSRDDDDVGNGNGEDDDDEFVNKRRLIDGEDEEDEETIPTVTPAAPVVVVAPTAAAAAPSTLRKPRRGSADPRIVYDPRYVIEELTVACAVDADSRQTDLSEYKFTQDQYGNWSWTVPFPQNVYWFGAPEIGPKELCVIALPNHVPENWIKNASADMINDHRRGLVALSNLLDAKHGKFSTGGVYEHFRDACRKQLADFATEEERRSWRSDPQTWESLVLILKTSCAADAATMTFLEKETADHKTPFDYVVTDIMDPAAGGFKNAMQWLMNAFEELLDCVHLHRNFLIALFCCLTRSKMEHDLRCHYIQAAQASTGKSWVLLMIARMFVEGIVDVIMHITPKLFTTEEGYRNKILLFDEMTNQFLGIPENGKAVGSGTATTGDPIAKAMTTMGYVETHEMVIENGRRVKKVTRCDTRCVIIGNTNEPSTSIVETMTARMMIMELTDRKRHGANYQDREEANDLGSRMCDSPDTKHFFKTMNWITTLVDWAYRFIDVGLLPPVEVGVGMTKFTEWTTELAKRGFDCDEKRDRKKFRAFLEAVVTFDATMHSFMWPGSRPDPKTDEKLQKMINATRQSRVRGWSMAEFSRMEPWLHSTQDHAYLAFSLVYPMFCDPNEPMGVMMLLRNKKMLEDPYRKIPVQIRDEMYYMPPTGTSDEMRDKNYFALKLPTSVTAPHFVQVNAAAVRCRQAMSTSRSRQSVETLTAHITKLLKRTCVVDVRDADGNPTGVMEAMPVMRLEGNLMLFLAEWAETVNDPEYANMGIDVMRSTLDATTATMYVLTAFEVVDDDGERRTPHLLQNVFVEPPKDAKPKMITTKQRSGTDLPARLIKNELTRAVVGRRLKESGLESRVGDVVPPLAEHAWWNRVQASGVKVTPRHDSGDWLCSKVHVDYSANAERRQRFMASLQTSADVLNIASSVLKMTDDELSQLAIDKIWDRIMDAMTMDWETPEDPKTLALDDGVKAQTTDVQKFRALELVNRPPKPPKTKKKKTSSSTTPPGVQVDAGFQDPNPGPPSSSSSSSSSSTMTGPGTVTTPTKTSSSSSSVPAKDSALSSILSKMREGGGGGGGGGNEAALKFMRTGKR